MCYLTMHSTHFYLWLYGRKEGNILFNDALNTFYLVIWKEGMKVGREGKKCFI